MDLANDLAIKTLLFEKTCDLGHQFGEQHLVIWTSIRGVRNFCEMPGPVSNMRPDRPAAEHAVAALPQSKA
jgi:hypothetical protein